MEFLILKEEEFIQQEYDKGNIKNKVKRNSYTKWTQGFDYQRVKIPEKSLPPNPDNKGAEIRNLSKDDISKIKDVNLANIFTQTKEKSEVKSLSSVSMMDLIFKKTPGAKLKQEISERIL